MLAEPRHEPKVRQGVTTELIGVDGNAYAPFPSREDLLDDSPCSTAASTAGPTSPSTGRRSPSTSPATTARPRSTSPTSSATRRSGSRPSAGTRSRRTTRASPTSGRRLREAMEDGAFGLSTGLDYPPGAYATTEELAALWPRRARGSAASTTPTSAIRWATGSSTRSGRRSRSGGGAARRSTSRTSTTGRRSRARPSRCSALVDDARAEGLDVTFDLYPYEWSSTRLLIMLPTWIQAGRRRAARRRASPTGPRASGSAPRWPARGRLFAGDRSWDARAARRTSPGPSTWPGRAGRWATSCATTGRDPVDAICDLLLAEDLRVNQVTPGPHTDGIRTFLRHPGGDGRHRRRAHRGQAVAADLRLVSRGSSASSCARSGCSGSRRRSTG